MALPTPKPEISTCNACGKLFPRVKMRLCTTCAVDDEKRYDLVRDFLIENQGAALPTIASETGVPHSDVRRFLDSGRLVVVQASLDATCACESSGQRCRTCRNDLASKLRSLGNEMAGDLRERGIDPAHPRTSPTSSGSGSPARDGRTQYVRRIRRISGDS